MNYFHECPQPFEVCKRAIGNFDDLHRAQRARRYKAVVSMADGISQLCARCPHAAKDKAAALIQLKQHEAADRIVDALLSSGLVDTEVYRYKGETQVHASGFEDALKWFILARDTSPGDHEANCELANALLRLGRPGEALPYAEVARKTAPREDMAAAVLCAILAELGDRRRLLDTIGTLSDVEWTDPPEMVLVARSLTEVGEHSLALSWCKQALRLDPNSIRALCLAGRLYFYDLRKYRLALATFRKLAKLDPEHHGRSAAMYIARVHGDVNGDWNRALETMVNARVRYPDDAEIKKFFKRVLDRTTGAATEKHQESEYWRKRFEAMENEHLTLRQAIIELRAASEPGIPLGVALVEGEGQSVEFIEAYPENAWDLAKEIAAFSTSNDGTIFLGVRDDGVVVGLLGIDTPKDKDTLLQRIRGVSSGTVSPAAHLSVAFLPRTEGLVVKLFVPCGGEPVYYAKHVPYLRDLDQSRPAAPQEVADLVRRKTT